MKTDTTLFDAEQRRMTNLAVFEAARNAWDAGSHRRTSRQRAKHFTYGRQWDDRVKLPDGRVVSEGEAALMSGARPLTNNLIRQMVKSIVGQYRLIAEKEQSEKRPCAESRETASRNCLEELDARALEEFLISGCAVRRVSRERRPGGTDVWIDNISPSRLFVNDFTDPRGLDIELIGMTTDMSYSELLSRFATDDGKLLDIERIYRSALDEAPFGSITGCIAEGDFLNPADPRRCRVIEVWTLERELTVRTLDPQTGRVAEMSRTRRKSLEAANVRRQRKGEQPLKLRDSVSTCWRGRWYAPDGTVLRSVKAADHPFVVKFYPLIDGEVHPFVEDIIDQQRHINRLITLIDHIIGTSSKGVLLFPAEARLREMPLRRIEELWSQPGAIISYRGAGGVKPEVITQSGAESSAANLLNVELKLIEQVSGVGSALQGLSPGSSTTGAALYEAQAERSLATLRDIFATFGAFREATHRKAGIKFEAVGAEGQASGSSL